jgi:hypothetical protein
LEFRKGRGVEGRDLTAYCGLYCGDCIRFKCRASDLSDELLDELEKQHFSQYANVKRHQEKGFENFQMTVSSLKAISSIKCEIPCRLGGDGCGGSCEIIICVTKKRLKGCWDCPGFEECDKLDFLKPFHGQGPLKNLRAIKEHGIESWTGYREKCYPWL